MAWAADPAPGLHAGAPPAPPAAVAGPRRPRGSGKRAAQARKIVNERPGITIPELAEAMGIQANYLYRVMPTLQKDGQVRKRGKGWHPAGGNGS